MRIIAGLLLLTFAHSDYPGGLQCYSYKTKPDRVVICPEARNAFCVKEVSNLNQDLCGQTQYFGDLYYKQGENLDYVKFVVCLHILTL